MVGILPSRRGIATRIDLLRSTGTRHAWRRFRRDRALKPLVPARRRRIVQALWVDAARELGAAVTELAPGRLEIRRGDAVATVTGQILTLNSPSSVTQAWDKPTAFELLAEAGLPFPEQLSFDAGDVEAAAAFLARGPIPCVVKPARSSGGDGVTGEIRLPRELRRAALSASRFCRELLIERQAEGEVFRLLVLDGTTIDVLHRLRPRVTGDGRSTVEELIFAEYDRRLRVDGDAGLKPLATDLDCLLSLERAGLSLRSVPAAGEVVSVKTVTNFNRAEDNHSLGTAVSPGLCAEAAAAAAALGLRLAGVDVVARTPLASLAESGGVIIDLNATPALHHHALVADPAAATRVAVPILSALLASRGRGDQERGAFAPEARIQ
jgi:D-alanine-D-alanine ligase-like ATP-grasp enzyme